MAFPKEVKFGVDDKGSPVILSAKESLSQVLYNIFMMEPNTYPSQPGKGIGIRRWLYKTEDEINEQELKSLIFDNCADLISFLEFDDIRIKVIDFQGQGILLIVLPLRVSEESLMLAFSTDNTDNIYYKFQVESMKLNEI